MDSAKKFSLQWNEYKTSIKETFGGLRKTGDYSDVTLASTSTLSTDHND